MNIQWDLHSGNGKPYVSQVKPMVFPPDPMGFAPAYDEELQLRAAARPATARGRRPQHHAPGARGQGGAVEGATPGPGAGRW